MKRKSQVRQYRDGERCFLSGLGTRKRKYSSDKNVRGGVSRRERTSPVGTAVGMVVVNVVNSYEENLMGEKDEAPHSAIYAGKNY